MERESWYLSPWFISILFAFSFLVVPLIVGIYLLKLQSRKRIDQYNSIVVETKAKEMELLTKEQELVERENQVNDMITEKQKEIAILELAHVQKLELLTVEKKKELTQRELEHIQKMDFLTEKKLKKIALLELAHVQKLEIITNEQQVRFEEKEESIRQREMDITMKEEELVNRKNELIELVNEKLKEISLIELAHIQKLESIEDEQKARFEEKEEKLKLRESELELKVLEKAQELEKLELLHLKKLDSITKGKEESLLLRENNVAIREKELKTAQQETDLLNQKIILLRQQLVSLEDELLYQSFGFYETRFDLENSEEYSRFLKLVRDKQKELVRNKMAAIDLPNWNKGKTKRTTIDKNIKLAIRSFNNECDTVIGKVKFHNVDVCEKRIRSAFHDINNLNAHNYFLLADDYLDLKLEELFLAHEYAQKKEDEKEEQRRIREQMREEQEVQRQLEEELTVLNKERQHLENAMKHASKFNEEKVNEIRMRLSEIEHQIEVVDYRVKNTKAGYVYVISNIGSFGENVYKIGMTRRLEPTERVRELSGASVPFKYDVHAMIFSEDAPQLEASLHRTFNHRRVNKINERKEFFQVSLDEIKQVVKQNHNAVMQFTMIAEAKEYRETLALNKIVKQQVI